MSDFHRTERPSRAEFAEFYAGYVAAAPAGDILATLEREGERALAFYRAVPPGKVHAAYAPGKWTVAEVLSHVSDGERVFSYRALRFGRGDATPLPGFDQEVWVPRSHANRRSWSDLLDELHVVRASSLHVFRSFAPEDWARLGEASGASVSVRALAWVVAGHELHHRRVLIERYGLAPPPD